MPPDRSTTISASCGRSGCVLGRDLDELETRLLCEGLEPDEQAALRLELVRVDEPVRRLVGEDDHRPVPGARTEQPEDEIAGRLVEVVAVVDREERRTRQHPVQERPGDFGQSLAQEPLVEGGGLGRRRQVEAEQDAQQRDPGDQRRLDRFDDEPEARDDLAGVRGRIEVQGRSHDRPHREVRGGRFVFLATGPEDPEIRRSGDDLVQQPGLADPGLADHLDEQPMAGARRLDRVEQRAQLGVSTRERQRRPSVLTSADHRPHDRRSHGLCLALGGERRDRRRVEHRLRAVRARSRSRGSGPPRPWP